MYDETKCGYDVYLEEKECERMLEKEEIAKLHRETLYADELSQKYKEEGGKDVIDYEDFVDAMWMQSKDGFMEGFVL